MELPRLTAEVLLCHALRRERAWLYAHSSDELTEVTWIHYGRYLHARTRRVPTQYITKQQEFYGRDFHVTPTVLIPRPETEHLVAAALERIRPGCRLLDVGTGSGAIAVTLALEASGIQVFGSDISPGALAIARQNARKHGAALHLVQADLTQPVASGSLDMLVSNPPYVAEDERILLAPEVRDHEPHVALFAGQDGLAVYRRLIAEARVVLRPGGWLLFELGHRSLEPVLHLLRQTDSWLEPAVLNDLAGIPRVLITRTASGRTSTSSSPVE